MGNTVSSRRISQRVPLTYPTLCDSFAATCSSFKHSHPPPLNERLCPHPPHSEERCLHLPRDLADPQPTPLSRVSRGPQLQSPDPLKHSQRPRLDIFPQQWPTRKAFTTSPRGPTSTPPWPPRTP